MRPAVVVDYVVATESARGVAIVYETDAFGERLFPALAEFPNTDAAYAYVRQLRRMNCAECET